jgi:hypothetical protein
MNERKVIPYAEPRPKVPPAAKLPFDEAALGAFIMSLLFNPLSVQFVLILVMVKPSRFSRLILCIGMSAIPVVFALIADVRIRAPGAAKRGRAFIAFALAIVGTSWALAWMLPRVRLE